MTVPGRPSLLRRHPAARGARPRVALAAAAVLTAGLTGASTLPGPGSGPAPDDASPSVVVSAPAPATEPAPVPTPVAVPENLRFDLDAVAVRVTPDPVPAPAPRASRAGDRTTPPGDVRDVAAVTLAGLPGSAGVTLLFDHPQMRGHLGAVFMGSPGYLLVNASRLAGDPGRTADVVRHEIAHIYQARLAATRGFAAVDARMTELFGDRGLERAADCVALELGATWTHYTRDCSGPGQADAVEALLAGRMP